MTKLHWKCRILLSTSRNLWDQNFRWLLNFFLPSLLSCILEGSSWINLKIIWWEPLAKAWHHWPKDALKKKLNEQLQLICYVSIMGRSWGASFYYNGEHACLDFHIANLFTRSCCSCMSKTFLFIFVMENIQ